MWWLLILAVPVIGVVAQWYRVNRRQYCREIIPGEIYHVGERKYQLPLLPIKDACHRSLTSVPLLHQDIIERQRLLLQNLSKILKMQRIPWFVSGGTLLGFVRHGCMLPYDDDVDIHVLWPSRYYFWGPQFVNDCAKEGLEVFTMRGASLEWAWAFGNATGVRCRLKGFATPTCDIFFEKPMSDGKWSKIESWRRGGAVVEPNQRETWSERDLFPIQTVTMDEGLLVNLPARPDRLLTTQYGDQVLSEIRFDGTILGSHAFYFSSIPFIWKTHCATERID